MIRAAALAVCLAAVALPATAREAPADYAGAWTLSGITEGPEVCTLTLGDEPAIGGWSIDLPQACLDTFHLSPDIAAWTVSADGAIVFLDPLRKPVLRFDEMAIGGYVSEPGGEDALSLDRLTAETAPTEQSRMAGTWVLVALGGTPTCVLTLTSAEDGMSGTMAPAEACGAPWKTTRFARWKRTPGAITLRNDAGKPIIVLRGDAIEGFTGGNARTGFVGLMRRWD